MHLAMALPRVIAVVRPGDDALAALLAQAGAQVTACAAAAGGMGESLAWGVAAAADADGWLVALADMPWIVPGTITQVAQGLVAGASIVVPRHAGRRGHPVGFAADHRAALLALHGDAGARDVVAAHAARVVALDVADAGVLRDVDRLEDLEMGSR
jgi:molybdenum cofactor cytidylyltransferase